MTIGFSNARLITMEESGEEMPLTTGWMTVAEGKIKDLGYGASLPQYCDKVVDLNGKVITPGLIDPHSHIGLYEEGNAKEGDDINEISNPSTPHLRVLDGINPRDIGFKSARERGVTCVCCLPGSANVIGGLGSVLKTAANQVDKMVLSPNSCLKVAFGENPKRIYGEKRENPVTRMAIAGVLREKLVQAAEWKKENTSSPKRDLQQQVFVDVLEDRLPIRVHAHRADDVMTAIRIAEEFGINIVLDHCMEGHFIAEEIAQRGISVVYGPMFLGRVKQELREMDERTPAVLMQAGVKVALTTDHPEISVGHLSLCAAVAAREGMGEMEALKAVTINPAEILGVASRVGSLATGKDADFVVWTGSPFEYMSKVDSVYIDGESVYAANGVPGSC